eukprot:TRINITY_DN1003_c5_g1_i1.p1 TRINITY_DN1003_c5_g1~~TRINITY_DN1003_c5_g1_i1.p1  ORF type:complete len:543 (+),score=96.35 TRINITY_DN1003_c5_g1_i1:52-1629(+)
MKQTLAAILATAVSVSCQDDRKNVLFIAVDDLRPELNHLGHEFMHTPNIDKLAAGGMSFQRAYVQYSFCAPSRNSFMTGRRPDTTKAWSFMNHFRQVGPDWVSMPQYFKENGYYTVGTGKLFHRGLPPSFDAPKSWDEFTHSGGCSGNTNGFPVLEPNVTNVKCPPATNGCHNVGELGSKASWCAVNTSTLTYPLADTVSVDSAKEYLQAAKKSGKPFFVGVGFHKPHLPWIYPIEFNTTYPDASELPGPKINTVPENMPLCSWHEAGFNNTWEHPTSGPLAQVYRRAYYSAVTFTDYNVGQVLGELDNLGLTENTVVAFIGDHGWQLGEMNLWKKMTNFELGVRVPLIIRAPWLEKSVGVKTTAFAEAVDLYQTLADLAGLPPPQDKLQGNSLAPILREGITTGTGIKNYTFSQFAKNFTEAPEVGKDELWGVCEGCNHPDIDVMGYSVRSDNWRYTEWITWNKTSFTPIWEQLHATELYDHTGDFGASFDASTPTHNVASDPSHSTLIVQLRSVLRAHFNGDQ